MPSALFLLIRTHDAYKTQVPAHVQITPVHRHFVSTLFFLNRVTGDYQYADFGYLQPQPYNEPELARGY